MQDANNQIESESQSPTIVIKATHGLASVKFKELWEYRELIAFLAWRDISVRYKQTLLGVAWAAIQPLAMMLVFSLFFGKLGKMPSDGTPYPLFSFAALLPWQFFASALSASGQSLISNANLLAKVYFPRLALPVSSLVPSALDFLCAFLVYLIMALAFQSLPTYRILLLPAFLLLAGAIALGCGLWVSALTVRYRDVKHILPFLIQLWLFASPVAYPSSIVPAPWNNLYALNPLVGVIDGVRWSLLRSYPAPHTETMLASVIIAGLLLISGILYFSKTERSFADEL